jgi:organic hydroperoxide reductase OsmC/OhrA
MSEMFDTTYCKGRQTWCQVFFTYYGGDRRHEGRGETRSSAQRVEGKASPEELVAAAHAACSSMALSHLLGETARPPENVELSVAATLA